MLGYDSLFTTLASAGATFVALTGGLVIQRLLTLQSVIAGHRADLDRANDRVAQAEQDLAEVQVEGRRRYRVLVAADDMFLDELYGNALRYHTSPEEQSPVTTTMRLDRLGSLLQPAGDPPAAAERQLLMEPLMTFARESIDAAESYAEDLAEGTITPSRLVDLVPRPASPGAWFEPGPIWEAMAERVGRDHWVDSRGGDPEDYVDHQTAGPDRDRVGRSLSRIRDQMGSRYRDRAFADVTSSRQALERRREEQAAISLPKFDGSLFVEFLITALLTVLLLVVPVLYLTPGGGARPDSDDASLVATIFFVGVTLYLLYFSWRVATVWKGTRPASAANDGGHSSVPPA